MDENQTQGTTAPKESNTMMMAVVGIIILVILAGAGYWFMQKDASKQKDTMTEKTAAPTEAMSPTEIMMEKGAVKTFNVTAKSFSFTPAEIRVKKGDTVKIVLTNSGGIHDWVLDEFNAKTKTIGAGETDTIEFIANEAGTFEYYCSVGNHRQMGMVGNLIVE